MEKKIYAHFDSEGIYVYQAFKPEIVAAALEKGTFSKGFNMERMTWIKPSFAWMLYRSGYASKHRQEAILKIKIRHEGFIEILRDAVPTTYDSNLFHSKELWSDTLKKSSVRYQWDPDRDLFLRKIERRAIQLGIRGQMVKNYVNDWILELEEVTHLAHEIKNSLSSKKLPVVPEETVYQIHDEKIRKQMQIEE
ncbi:DUF4291 domain-containing protein [Candidatus Uabimicrobium amorphum]|uniref:DUF4291 domain-containing protein n=1 Tax=Uabimicrobium amorphum TaxID=2596890 RepID=A0A5S9IM84_UABAM|nr:DUF4291 domain-containing protein [Candidatus Uabimicrobium amorphum]BBM84107.1 hypothetical protein UABAM_02463 [Candidatus Uabimicrobium amorphum]